MPITKQTQPVITNEPRCTTTFLYKHHPFLLNRDDNPPKTFSWITVNDEPLLRVILNIHPPLLKKGTVLEPPKLILSHSLKQRMYINIIRNKNSSFYHHGNGKFVSYSVIIRIELMNYMKSFVNMYKASEFTT